MIKIIKPYKDYKAGEIVGLGCVQESKLIQKGVAIKLKLPCQNYELKS